MRQRARVKRFFLLEERGPVESKIYIGVEDPFLKIKSSQGPDLSQV
jgi:hypothetical protein